MLSILKKNDYFVEAKMFVGNFTEWLLLLLVFTIFFFAFGIHNITIFGYTFSVPMLSRESFSVQFFDRMVYDLVPNGVTLMVTNPLTAFIAQTKIAVFLAFIFTFPVLIFRLLKYFSPALHKHERIAVFAFALPTAILFALGVVFSYVVMIKPTFSILYSYTGSMGAVPFFTVNEFVNLVLAFSIASGLLFLLPIVMVLLTRFGIVTYDFWKSQWRYAIIVFLIVSAIITPDGSGVTMMLLSAPMAGLYGVGLFVSQRLTKKRQL